MASYDSFRVRRSVDPKPIHYGSFARESRNTSSLNDLDAAWENVDEARSALQAVEARIQEANFGLRNRRTQEPNLNEPAVREVFSQNQRLGRVSRYELRPTVNELQYPRESERSPRPISSTRKITPNSYTCTTSYSKYGGSIDSTRQHSLPSRDRTISPAYINDTNINNSEENDLSLQRNLDFNRTRDVDKPSRVCDSSSFDDNTEVSSVKRKKLNGLKPLSPLSSISDKSDALARLKERIQKQKERTPVPKQKENEDSVVNKIQSSFEERPVIMEKEESFVKPVCKRKVVAAPPPTGYKGFSIPNTAPVSSKEKDSRPQSRDSSYAPSTKAGQKRSSVPQKPNQSTCTNGKTSKGGVKMRRITAPRAPMDFITPYSWRTGMETVKKVLGPSNTRPKSSASSRPQSTVSQDTTSTISRMGIREWEDETRDENEKKSANEEKPVKPEENGFADDTELSEGLLSEGVLSEDAKNVLSDLDLDSDKSDDEEEKLNKSKPKQERIATKNAPKMKSPPTKKSKTFIKKKMPPKQKSPDTMPPNSMIQRNYDVDKVKKYMEKKIKDRKQKLREEKKMKQEAVDGRKKRLETLYNKQKKILATNLNQNSSKCKLGETHSVIPGHFTFQHQQIGYLPEFFSHESESEKDGTDVASFNGLPTPSPRGHQMSSSNDHHSDEISDASSDLSLQSLNESHSRLPNTNKEEEPDNQDDITLTPGESSYTESRALNGEMGRDEREEEIAYPRIPSNPIQLSSRTNRIEALKNTAADLKNRLEQEARRLGLTMLEKAEVEPPLASKGVTLKEPDVFRGNLPGVSNLHEQAELNDTLESMNSAATRIQAVYRGYSTRQGLNWRLPSGQTLGGIIRNAPRRTPVEGRAESIPLYLASDTSSDSHLSDVETAYSHESDRSLLSRNRKPGSMLESRSSTASHRLQTKGPASTSFSNGHYRPSTTLGKTLTETKGDRMSVINIYLRNLSSLRQGQEDRFLDSEKKGEDNDTGSLYSDDFNLDKSSGPASLIHDDEDLKDGSLDLDKTLVKESPLRESPLRESPPRESPLRDSIDIEQNLENHSTSVDRSFSHSGSSRGSPTESLSLSQTDTEYSPIRPSERSPSPTYDVRGRSTHPGEPTSRYHPPLYYPSHQGGDRMSPGSLDQRMLAELNRLEFMEESVRQLTDIERTNAVSLAQQETVSLAQILKAKQAAYAKEMEALQIKAQKEKLDAARELDEARYSAKKSTLDAQEAVAKVKAEAADNIVQSADRLVKAQTEAARVTTDSAKKVEEARNEAARTLLAAANHQVTDVREVASSAASAAAQEAVRTTLEEFRQELRPSRKYDTSHSTPDSRSRGSYSRDSYSDERSPSYSRSRSSRIASERESGASKAADGGGYTSDEFESFKESETAKSVRTASPDRTYVSNHDSLVQERERSGTKSSESIAEEVDASVSEGSIASDSIIANKSIEEAVDDRKDQTNPEYSMTFEESMVSSRNVTDDEMDYRLILPSEGHRRRSIGKTQRSGSVCSDAVSYSSDENLDKHSESTHEKNTPFSGEDSFSKFTADMVKLMREEEVRAKHLEALLHLREKALKENTKAEMEWLELQKKQMRDKGADDAMPFIKKRQRDVIKRLKTEKAEIKYLMAAHRAARYDRRLMMMNQEEITRLRRSTHKIRGKVREEEGSRDKTKSDVQEDISSPQTRRSTPLSTGRPQDESPSKSTTVPEEISAIDSPTADTSFPTYENESTISERARKRSLSEGESDDGAASGSATRSKGSPSTSDSIVMQQLKKLKSQSSERYLTQREQKLMRRKHEGEDLSDRKLIEWERRLDEEDDKRNDKNRVKSKRAVKATQNRLKEEDLAAMAPGRSREGSIPEVDYISKDFSEASDHSDVESRVRELREQLQQREQEVRRLHKEQKRQKRAMLHEEEENLRKKLQAVERILQQTKENLERPSTTSKPEAAVTNQPPAVKTSSETIPDKLSLIESTATQSRPFTSRDPSTIKEEATEKLRASPSNSSISEKLSLMKSTPEEQSTSDSKQTKKSSFSDGPFKGLNVVLDLDFSSKDQGQGDKEPQSISEVKDLDISDRSGVFDKEDDYTPFSQSEEIKDIAPTPEDISQASEIQTISERSGIEELSRSPSLQSPEIQSKRSGVESQNSLRELSEKQPSEEDSISEAISARSSKRSGTQSISEAISARSSKRSGTESISEALSLRSAQRSKSESVPESLATKSKSEEVLGSRSKSPVNDYSNTFESEQNQDETDDDISEQIIEEEEQNGLPTKDASPKSYTPDFEQSESNIPSNLEIKDRSANNTSLYSQDFEAPSSCDKLEQPSLEKSVRVGQPEEGNEPEVLTQHRLSQATDEESIAEEIPEEENKSASLSESNHEAGPLDEDKDVPNISSSKDISHEENYSQYSQDFESPSSPKVSNSLSKGEELGQKSDGEVPQLGDASGEKSISEEIPEDQVSVESGSLSEASDETTPRFSLSEQRSIDKDKSVNLSEAECGKLSLEEKDQSQYSQDFESPSSHQKSKQSSAEEKLGEAGRDKEHKPESDVISPQRRLSDATDDESVAEELPEEQHSLESGHLSDDDKHSQFLVGVPTEQLPELDASSPSKSEKDISSNKDVDEEALPTKPFVDKDEFRRQQADKIALDLSSTLVSDAVTCISSVYEDHKLKGTATPQSDEKTAQSSKPDSLVDPKLDSDKEDSINEWGKPPEEGFEVSEGEDLSISERLSFTDDEVSLPMLDLKPLDTGSHKDKVVSPVQAIEEKESHQPEIDKKAENEQVLKDLSENLLKEAASKMISLMRQKQAKLKTLEQTQKVDKKELPSSPPPYSPELSPRGFDKFMAVMKQSSPPGSPTKDGGPIDSIELTDKLSQLKLLHDEIGSHLGDDDDDDDDFVINANKPLELPTDKEEYGPPSGQTIPLVVPHNSDDVIPIVSTSLATFYQRRKSGGSLTSVTPPPEFSESNVDESDPDSKVKQSYRRMIFDITGEVFRDVLNEESPADRPSWMKPRRRRKNRFYHTLSPVTDEHDYLPIVQQRVLDLVGLGSERPNIDTLRRKTPLKLGKKDFVDAVLIQELREEEPQWIDYDDDELAVKFQVADAIFESLMSETIMVLNAVQRRKESMSDVA